MNARESLVWLAMALPVGGCFLAPQDDSAAASDEAETGTDEAALTLSCLNYDSYSGSCCGSRGSFTDSSSKNVCCPPNTVSLNDPNAPNGVTCGPVNSASYIAEDLLPANYENNQWVRWVGTANWYPKSQWQSWGLPVFRRAMSGVETIETSWQGQFYGEVERTYRNGTTQSPYGKYFNSTSYYIITNCYFTMNNNYVCP